MFSAFMCFLLPFFLQENEASSGAIFVYDLFSFIGAGNKNFHRLQILKLNLILKDGVN